MRNSKLVMAGAALVLGIVVGGAAFAAATNHNDVIHSCVNNESGTVQIVDSPDDCHPNWSPLSWNQQGAPGAGGADGADGTDGADGADGGVSGLERVTANKILSGPSTAGTLVTVQVTCPAGKKVLGGGGITTTTSAFINESSANTALTNWTTRWVTTADSETDLLFVATATCAVAP